jgi:putative endonuclease
MSTTKDRRASTGRIGLGKRGEQLAAEHLEAAGYEVLERNYRCRAGEIDLIARDADTIVFVEVKARRGAFNPLEAVDSRKQAQISRVAFDYFLKLRIAGGAARFDVIAVDGDSGECVHIVDAFDSTLEY